MQRVSKEILCLTLLCFLFFLSPSVFGGTGEFFNSLEYLLANYGNAPNNWPDCNQKLLVQQYILLNFEKSLDECIFGGNFLGYGVFHSPDEAHHDLAKGSVDAWGKPYDQIFASSPDGKMFFDVPRSVGNHLEVAFFNPQLKNKVFIFLKADLHSQFSDVFRNFNGKEFTLVAREINFFGAPASAHKNYFDYISPALSSAHCTKATIWVGGKDTITRIPHNIFLGITAPFNVKTTKNENLLGLKWQIKFGPGGQTVATVKLDGVNHPLKSYFKAIQENMKKPVYIISTTKGFRTLTEEALINPKFPMIGKWQKTPDKEGWYLVGRNEAPKSEWVAILVTTPNEGTSEIAKKIRDRNEREHPDKKAIVLLDGNPSSERNISLSKALKAEGYEHDDIFVVWKGNLYTKDGDLVANGKYILPDGAADDPVLAQGIWGHVLKNFTDRPVYGDPVTGSEQKQSVGGIDIDPKLSKTGKADSGLKNNVIQSRPSEDSLSWPVKFPFVED